MWPNKSRSLRRGVRPMPGDPWPHRAHVPASRWRLQNATRGRPCPATRRSAHPERSVHDPAAGRRSCRCPGSHTQDLKYTVATCIPPYARLCPLQPIDGDTAYGFGDFAENRHHTRHLFDDKEKPGNRFPPIARLWCAPHRKSGVSSSPFPSCDERHLLPFGSYLFRIDQPISANVHTHRHPICSNRRFDQ